ncbi:hypothetical protein [Shouchella lonarensis]|uniref:DUF3278 domain-containing protein n=1 Tax=Shouchella lonarensis TaxID=1464122 RepID=A0A1G6GH78_9BACI|nr:hypothetical protein [Shouchella lonarensis]SDB81300.1 hypothetical protein SAMN05421737_10150 [Shouchella lonarensis]
MIRSWIGWLLPEDEYKRQKVLYFIAEGAGLSFVVSFLSYSYSLFLMNSTNYDLLFFIFFASIMIFPFYVTIRYVLSGLEHANIDGENDQNAKKKSLLKSTGIVSLIFLLSNILYKPFASYGWFDIVGKATFFALFWYVAGYVSLSRAIRKSRQLDE